MKDHLNLLRETILTVFILLQSTHLFALPPIQETSADHVTIRIEHDVSNYYRFTAGEYHYRFLWDGGPTYLKVHGIIGYDSFGNVIAQAPAEVAKEGEPAKDYQFKFQGVGRVRHASTTEYFRVPATFYLDRNICHIAVDFSVVDGRMSVGPWLPMSGNWGDAASVREHLELLLW